jgi:hypothetical protein
MQATNPPKFKVYMPPLCNKNAKTPKTAQSTPCRCSPGLVATQTNTKPIKFYCK